jgi:hypothetical protein
MRFDYHAGRLFSDIDDIYYKYHDAATYRRFLKVFAGLPSVPQNILTAIIRRHDLDGDARLSPKEFEDMVKPAIKFNKRKAQTNGLEPYFKKPALQQSKSTKAIKPIKEIKDIK